MESTAPAPGVSDTAAAIALDLNPPAGQETAPEGNPPGDNLAAREDFDALVEEYIAQTAPGRQVEEAPVAPKPEDSDVEPDANESPSVSDKAPKNWRITAKSDLESRAFELYRRNPDMSLEEALQRVGGKKAPVTAEEPNGTVPVSETKAPEQTKSDAPTVESLTARRKELIAEIKQANSDFDYERASDLQIELAELPFKIMQAQEQERSAATAKHTAFESAVAEAEARAIAMYPDISVDGSEFRARMEDIHARLEEAGDDLLSQPDCGLRIAQMAARELNIAPSAKSGKQSPPQAAGQQAPERKAPTSVKPRPMTGTGAAHQAAPEVDYSKLGIDELEALAARM